ncbi:hypothetical protein E2C01_079153 [Portunus trituberculatus]|uniref:Uncharacterized protein n=1 Tax=Portunus trituberculatus TaxID=210409 RepID=A0A5B7IRZ7_PORTR|nr:hypothetical protein [Portunus trituberculatus]
MIIVGAFRAGHGAPPRSAARGTTRPAPPRPAPRPRGDGWPRRLHGMGGGRRQQAGALTFRPR